MRNDAIDDPWRRNRLSSQKTATAEFDGPWPTPALCAEVSLLRYTPLQTRRYTVLPKLIGYTVALLRMQNALSTDRFTTSIAGIIRSCSCQITNCSKTTVLCDVAPCRLVWWWRQLATLKRRCGMGWVCRAQVGYEKLTWIQKEKKMCITKSLMTQVHTDIIFRSGFMVSIPGSSLLATTSNAALSQDNL